MSSSWQEGREAMEISVATKRDRDAIWHIFHQIVALGDTYAFDPNMSRKQALAYWFRPDAHTYVGKLDCFEESRSKQTQRVVGTYILRPNQSGGGSHVANAAFMVAPEARGQGIGRAMGEHCLSEARRLGFRGMQFNFVISANQSAVRLWDNLGFKIVGTLPGAFRHPEKGYVDVYVMFRSLL
jgi:ribosomal protein S18 acetylase RimI-like enzyme